jgi:hypothetical protein
MFLSRHFFNAEEISREMELWYARILLLDFGKGCPYYGIQATGKMAGVGYLILFVLNKKTYTKKTVQMFNLCCKYP